MHKLLSYFLIISILIVSCKSNNKKDHQQNKKEDLEGSISISGAFALYPLVVKWAEEFHKLHSGVKIDVSAGGAGKGMTDALSGMVNLGMVSRDISKEEIAKGAWFIPVTKDAVVATINEKNPVLKDILKKGIKQETFKEIFINGKITTWGKIVGSNNKDIVKPYTRSDACGAAEVWAKYLGKKQEDIKGTGVFGDPGVARAVQDDILGIGYNNIAFVYDSKTKKEHGVKVAPIDINNNGKIDDDENFYENVNTLVQAISNGKYHSPPARLLNLVSKGKPKDIVTLEFLRWILTDGQKFVAESGYINITDELIKSNLEKLK
jgi:phosphate transport system substrate-binding protein